MNDDTSPASEQLFGGSAIPLWRVAKLFLHGGERVGDHRRTVGLREISLPEQSAALPLQGAPVRSLERVGSPVEIPEPEAELKGALFDALTILFVRPQGAERARFAIAHAVGEPTFEILTAFLAFVRTAHYWTETPPLWSMRATSLR
jgi:hypothetical protein